MMLAVAMAVPPAVMAVLREAQRIHAVTDGAFDVTVGGLKAWHFGEGVQQMPQAEEVARQLSLVGAQDLVLDTNAGTAFLRRRGMALDLGGIAKLPILEAGMRVLQEHGIDNAMVNGGVDTHGITFDYVMEDVETLNQWAVQGKLDITKLSYNTFLKVTDRYALLHSGSALGVGVGPLLISKQPLDEARMADYRIAIPGLNTTANLLLTLAYPQARALIPPKDLEAMGIEMARRRALRLSKSELAERAGKVREVVDRLEAGKDSTVSSLLAVLAAVGVYLFLWRTRAGYHLRAVGSSAGAAEYAGIRPRRQIMVAMAVSGALAGMVGMNEIAGVNGKLLLEFVSGAGFTGIAVALMGRNHPVGIVLASILFGALFQGGAEVAFEVRGFSREMVVMLQGFIVLFSGAMVYVIAPVVGWLLALAKRRPSGAAHG